MATAAPPPGTPQPNVEVDLSGFSASVQGVASSLGPSHVPAEQIVDDLLRSHPDYGGSELAPLPPASHARPVGEWLARVRRIHDSEAVARRSQVIDGRLTILALGRLVPGIESDLRRSRLRWRLERDLGFRQAAVLHPWALPPGPVDVAEVWSLPAGSGVNSCAFEPDGSLVALAGADGSISLSRLDVQASARVLEGHRGPVLRCAWSLDGTLLASVGTDETVRIWDTASGEQRHVLDTTAADCAFSPDGATLATAGGDTYLRFWEIASGAEASSYGGSGSPLRACEFLPDGRVAGAASDGMLFILDRTTVQALPLRHDAPVYDCSVSSDGTVIASAAGDGHAYLWDTATGERVGELRHDGGVDSCAFRPGSRLLATGGFGSGFHLWDTISETQIAALPYEGEQQHVAYSPAGGLFAVSGGDGSARILEELEPAGQLPRVAADLVGGPDLVGVGKDAAALANVIAASETLPPLSIGLFGDWGAGKTFLIGEVQRRVRAITRRSRGRKSAYCSNVRNIVFNAWHYADANLWASIVSHIFDELAKPEPESGVGEQEARKQAARLEEELASNEVLTDRLVRAQEQARQAEARKSLLRWLAGAPDDATLGNLTKARPFVALLFRNPWTLGALLVLAAAAAIAAASGVGWKALSLLALWVPVAVAWRARLGSLLKTAGETAKVADVRTPDLDAQVDAARKRTEELQEEIADLASGRRLARFAARKTSEGGYRAQLGLVSQIHGDFNRMSKLLTDPPAEVAGDLPRIDRIVLYIDDLDRCEPRRVVDVLKAVHLILAVPLFVVVIAVDPRWLLSSLKLHYAELFGAQEDEEAWQSSPLHYLEKIIQVPFALRPMGGGVETLVQGLLPVVAPAAPGLGGVAPADDAAPDEGGPGETQADEYAAGAAASPPPEPRPSLSPRNLGLTPPEGDFAVTVAAAALRTPRAVKKFTNLYRLLRAGLTDDELDEFLAADTGDLAQYRAAMILLGIVIAFPEEASDFLVGLGNLDPDADRDPRSARDYFQTHDGELGAFLAEVAPEGDWTREPFRRWALEVSRYSFATGQEVFAEFRPHAT